jgi:preprotein translocase subunit SecG
VLVIWAISGIGLVAFVLLHSGKGTGLSDVIAGQVYNNQSGSGVVEKNLNRITIVLAVVFFATLLVLMLIYPQGTI